MKTKLPNEGVETLRDLRQEWLLRAESHQGHEADAESTPSLWRCVCFILPGENGKWVWLGCAPVSMLQPLSLLPTSGRWEQGAQGWS